MIHKATAGNTLSEYGILMGLVVVASLISVNLLGDSVNTLFGKTDQTMKSGEAQKLVSLNFGGGGTTGTSGSGNGQTIGITGSPSSDSHINAKLKVSEGNSSGLNATAAEGATNKVDAAYQNANFAVQMENRLSTSMDPALYDWASKITRYSKLAAGAEGVLNNLSAFETSQNNTALSAEQSANTDGLTNNLIDYQSSLKNLISSPPPGANGADVKFFSNLGNNVASNINHQTAGKTVKTNLANEGSTLLLNDFSQYMNEAQLDQAIHTTAQSGEAKKVSQGLDTVMNSSDTLNTTP